MRVDDIFEGLKDPKDNPCWKGYHPVGTKKKNGRTVPNCVPRANEAVNLDRNKNPDYPNDPETVKHRTDSANKLLSDPKTDPDSRREASAVLARYGKKKSGVTEGIRVVDQDYDLDQIILTLDIEGRRASFTYTDYDENFDNAERKDVHDQLQRNDWYATLSHPDRMEILDAAYRAIRGEEPGEYRPTVDDEPMDVVDRLGEQGMAEGSDWGEPEELLSDVMSALERQVEWPLTDIMDRQEVQKLLQPVRDAVNAKMKNIAQGVAEGEHPKTWHDVDPKLGKQVDKMSQAEKVSKGFAHSDTLKKKTNFIQKLDAKLQQLGYTQTQEGNVYRWIGSNGTFVEVEPNTEDPGWYGWAEGQVTKSGKLNYGDSGNDSAKDIVAIFKSGGVFRKQGVAEGLNEFAPSGGGDGRWYSDDQLYEIVGEDWLEAFDVSGDQGNIDLRGERARLFLAQEAEAWLTDRGYRVNVLDVRDDGDSLSWYIQGPLYKGVMEGSFNKKGIVAALVDARRTIKQVQIGQAKFPPGFASQLEIALYDAINVLRDDPNPGVQNTVAELSDLRAVVKQVQTGKESFPPGFASQLEWVVYDAIVQIENQKELDEGWKKALATGAIAAATALGSPAHATEPLPVMATIVAKMPDGSTKTFKKDLGNSYDYRLEDAKKDIENLLDRKGIKNYSIHLDRYESGKDSKASTKDYSAKSDYIDNTPYRAKSSNIDYLDRSPAVNTGVGKSDRYLDKSSKDMYENFQESYDLLQDTLRNLEHDLLGPKGKK